MLMKLLTILVREVKTVSSEQASSKSAFALQEPFPLHQAPSSLFSTFVTGKGSALICEEFASVKLGRIKIIKHFVCVVSPEGEGLILKRGLEKQLQ